MIREATIDRLVAAARQARAAAYAPYSQFSVGAALLAASGKIYTGCNVENAVYGATLCAERNAVAKAVSEGERSFQAIAVIGSGSGWCSPCGICRQVLSEFGSEITVILADERGRTRCISLAALLPDAFGPAALRRAHAIETEGDEGV